MRSSRVLRCRECAAETPLAPVPCCLECFAPVEVAYPPVAVTRAEMTSRPATMWRYREWLPLEEPSVAVPVRRTPLVRADRLARAWGVERLWLKDEGANPSGSFKDRLVTVALHMAREFGLTTVICASTGNLARSVLALAPAFGLTGHVLVPEAAAPERAIAVRGTYDQANRLAIQAAEARGWAVVNVTLGPCYAEGGKTVGHEIAEELGRLPGHVVCPMGGGGLLTKIHQGMREMADAGLVASVPVKVHGAQAAGCAPIVRAFAEGRDEVTPVRDPATRAHSIAVGDPGEGYTALRLIRARGGAAEAVADDEAQEACEQLFQLEGISTELAGGVTLAAARRLIERGEIRRDEEIVLILTGRPHTTSVTGPPLAVIEPTREAFDRLL